MNQTSKIMRGDDTFSHYNQTVQAAWLYYRDGMSQQEIAQAMGVSRSSVSNLLVAAKHAGVYSVKFNEQTLLSMDTSRRLTELFALEGVYVVPSNGTQEDVRRRVGSAGALYLTTALRDCRHIGISWGQTVLEIGLALEPTRTDIAKIFQMVGIARTDFWKLAETCNSRIGLKLNADVMQFPAPGRVSSRALFDLLVREPIVVEQLEALRALDASIFGLCSISDDSLFFSSGLAEGLSPDALREMGVAGIIGGRMFDHEGRAVTVDEYDSTLLALDLDEHRAIPVRMGVASGAKKIDALAGALRGGHLTALVTDQDTAVALLERF